MSSECGCGVVSGQALALRILSCLELHTNVRHYNNIRELSSMSADLKIRASQRPRPTVLNFAECFQKTVEEYRESGAMRRMRDSDIIYQAVKESCVERHPHPQRGQVHVVVVEGRGGIQQQSGPGQEATAVCELVQQCCRLP